MKKCITYNITGPGSFIEVSKILPLLTNPPEGKQAFHVVAPSLPNYGFSDRISAPKFSIAQYVESVHQVMLAAGYEQYGKYNRVKLPLV